MLFKPLAENALENRKKTHSVFLVWILWCLVVVVQPHEPEGASPCCGMTAQNSISIPGTNPSNSMFCFPTCRDELTSII